MTIESEAEPALDYERLDVYRCSMELLQLSIRAIGAIPRREDELRSQPARIDIHSAQHRGR